MAGDRLPYGSRYSGNIALNQEFDLTAGIKAFVGGAVSYVGDREGVFTATAQRQMFPAYTKTDLHAGAKYESWTLNLFVNNLADPRGVLGGGLGTYNPAAFTYVPPRTVGLSVQRAF